MTVRGQDFAQPTIDSVLAQDLLKLPSFGIEAVATHCESCIRSGTVYLEAGPNTTNGSIISRHHPVLFALNPLTGNNPPKYDRHDEPHLYALITNYICMLNASPAGFGS